MNKIQLELLRQFRQELYQILAPSRDAAFEVIDALAGSRDARSAVEVSLSPTMQRRFSSVYKATQRTRLPEADLRRLLTRYAETAGDLQFAGWLLYALDHTPYPRADAPTVFDRGYVHGADGIVVGHQYSLLGRIMHSTGSWVGIVDARRIATTHTPNEVGAAQIADLKENATQPRIISADSEYVSEELLDQADDKTRLLIRFKRNRNLYDAPPPKAPGAPGPPPKRGAKMKLNRPESLRPPDYSYRVENPGGGWTIIAVWANVFVATRPELPLCAVRVEVFRADGRRRYQNPLWLAWTGPADMDWPEFWRVYLRRFCLECVHQFTKNSLAWTRGRFSYTGREERWTWLVILAYWQLLLAAPLAQDICRPWEKPTRPGRLPTPGRVQRDYGRIYRELGSPTRAPKVRGIPPGRPPGYRPAPRPRYRTVYKSKKGEKEAPPAA